MSTALAAELKLKISTFELGSYVEEPTEVWNSEEQLKELLNLGDDLHSAKVLTIFIHIIELSDNDKSFNDLLNLDVLKAMKIVFPHTDFLQKIKVLEGNVNILMNDVATIKTILADLPNQFQLLRNEILNLNDQITTISSSSSSTKKHSRNDDNDSPNKRGTGAGPH